MAILSESNRAALLRYKYKGGDTSPIYAHVLSPFAQFWVDFMPAWVAPNTITLSGLSLPLAMSVVSAVYNPSLGPEAPSWLALWSAAALFIYQTMDNMDGKQARKIGASSPLGMLFDHVCDAINSGTSCIFVGSFLGCGWEWAFWFCILAFIPFHMQTWEEYYRQEMVLPVINGPSEGILMIIGLALSAYFKGAEWWQQEFHWSDEYLAAIPYLEQFNTNFLCALVFFTLFALCTVLTNSWTVIKIVIKSKGCLLKTLLSLSPFIAFIGSACAWKLNSPVVAQFPLVSILLMVAVFVEGVSHVMLAHIVEDELKPFERVLSWMMVGMAVNVCFTPFGQPIVDERLLLIPYFITAVSTTGLRLVMICQESASALDIFVFRVGKRSAKKD